MTYLPPFNGGRVNATISGNTAGAGSLVSSGTLTLAGGNNITLSQAGNAITISGANAPSGSINFSAGTTSNNLAAITFANSNGINFGLNGSTLTASHNALTSQSNQAVSGSNGSVTFQTLSFTNANGISFGTSNNSAIMASYTVPNVPAQTNQTVGFTAGTTNGGNTSLTSTGTFDARSMYLNAHGAISAGFSNSSLFISAPTQTSFSLSGNGVTFNTNGSTVSASVATTYAASNHSHGNPTLNLTNISGTTASASNGLTLSLSAAAAAAQTVQTQNLMTVNGTQGNVSISGGNNITVSNNASTMIISGPAMFNGGAVNTAAGGSTYGSMGATNTAGLALYAGTNIGLSQVTGVGGASVTIQAAGGGGGGGGIALANSQTTYSTGTANFVASGAMTIASTTGQSFNFSVPATSSLAALGAINLSTTGATINISAPAMGTIGNWEPQPFNQISTGSMTLNTTGGIQYFYKLQVPAYVSATQFQQLVSISLSSSAGSSYAGTVSIGAGIYTATGSTLSLIAMSSGSASYVWTNTSNNSYASLSGLRGLTIPMTVNMAPGNYWLGMWSKTASAGAGNWATVGNVVVSNAQATYQGMIGQAANATQGIQENVGYHSVTQNALMASASMAQIIQSRLASNFAQYVAFKNTTW